MNMYNVNTTIRRKLSQFLIRLANRINSSEYYDFGEPIVNMFALNKRLFIATEGKVYKMIKDNKWKLVSSYIRSTISTL